MVSQGSYKLFLYLTILLGVLLVHSCEGQSWGDFRTKHIDYPTTRAPNPNAYCSTMMQRRGLTRPTCKPTNTFINAPHASVRNVCTRVGNGNATSQRRFRVVECRNRGSPTRCNYIGRRRTGRVRLGCRNRVPVHLAGVI